jgi:hypothetical protein
MLERRVWVRLRRSRCVLTDGVSIRQERFFFPGAVIPQAALALPATKMLQFIPTPNLGASEFSTATDKQWVNDDKGSGRIDINTSRYGTFSAYYFAGNYMGAE